MTTCRLLFHPSRSFAALAWLVVLTGLTFTASAQGSSDGSIYSRFGLGERRALTSSTLQGMGGGGAAVHSFEYVNFANPASWGDQVFTRAAMGALYEGLRQTNALNRESRLSSSALNALQLSFPLLSRKLGVGLSFAPYSRVAYRVREQGLLAPDPAIQDTSTYVNIFSGKGGLQEVMAGLGYRISPNLSIGMNLNFIFGIIEESQRTAFINTTYIPINLTKATRLTGMTATAGALVSFRNVLGKDDLVSVGFAATLPTHLSGERIRTLGGLEPDTLGTPTDGTADLPYHIQVGLAYRTNAKWTFIADGSLEPWSNFESSFRFPGYTPGQTNAFSDRKRFSAGVEFLPAGRDILAGYLERSTYRVGFYYDQSYVSPDPNVDIRTLAITGGIGLPTMVPGTRLDINWAIGTRGTTSHNLIHDRFYRIGLNVNFGERWFVKRKLG